MQQAHIVRMSNPAKMNPLASTSDLQRLAAVESTDADFLSCYVDLKAGSARFDAWFEKSADAQRSKFHGVVRIDFEQAVESVRSAMTDIWVDPMMQDRPAVAVFARGPADDRNVTIIPLDAPVEPRLVFYRIPDLRSVAVKGHSQSAFTLVLARQQGVQVLEIDGETVTPKAWAAFRENATHRAPSAGGTQRRFLILRRALAGSATTPLVIAGDGPCLDEVTAALPARATARLRDVCRMPAHVDQAGVIQRVRQRLAQRRELSDYQLASRLVRTVRNKGMAVAGPIACREALRTGVADALVVGKRQAQSTVWECEACEGLAVSAAQPQQCGQCGEDAAQRWETEAELVRLACQRGVEIVYSDADALIEIGGFGCLLREQVEASVIEAPQVDEKTFDLVA